MLLPVILIEGNSLTVTTLDDDAVQPLLSVAVTVYELVEIGLMFIKVVVAPLLQI